MRPCNGGRAPDAGRQSDDESLHSVATACLADGAWPHIRIQAMWCYTVMFIEVGGGL